MKFEKGQVVKQKVVVAQGKVAARRINPDTDAIEYLMRWQDAERNDHERWWTETELEAA